MTQMPMLQMKAGTAVTKILACFGKNASGKTNLLKALSFSKWFIRKSFNLKPDEQIPIQPFLLIAIKQKALIYLLILILTRKYIVIHFKSHENRLLMNLYISGIIKDSNIYSNEIGMIRKRSLILSQKTRATQFI